MGTPVPVKVLHMCSMLQGAELHAMQVHWVTSVMIMRIATQNRQYKEAEGITQALQARPAQI